MKKSVAFILLLLLAGCGGFAEKPDETKGMSVSKLYSEAKGELLEGNYENAIKLYETLESRFPYGLYAQQAQLEVAYAHYKSNDTESAIAAADRFIKLYPNHPHVDYAHYLKGLANFNEDLGLFALVEGAVGEYVGKQDPTERDPKTVRDSFDAFKELVTRFPNSKYTPDATARMKYLVNALAAHEVHVARYYLKRGAYVAAVNRSQLVLQQYPQAPANEEALAIMVKAYDAMGMNELRDDAMRVMRKNFPKSRYFSTATDSGKPWWKLF